MKISSETVKRHLNIISNPNPISREIGGQNVRLTKKLVARKAQYFNISKPESLYGTGPLN
jgi:hypothetical protein